jgi:hypothetical protein
MPAIVAGMITGVTWFTACDRAADGVPDPLNSAPGAVRAGTMSSSGIAGSGLAFPGQDETLTMRERIQRELR